jgi:ribosomal protein S5
MTGKFKPYTHNGSIIYSPKNREFLERFAEVLIKIPRSEKVKMEGRAVKFGGINYLVVLNEHGKVRLGSKTNRMIGPVFLAEE